MSDEMMIRCFLLLWAPGYSIFKSGHSEDGELFCIQDSVVQLAADKMTQGDVARFINKMTPEILYQLKEYADATEEDDGCAILAVYNQLIRFQECKKTVRDILLKDCFGENTEQYVENRLSEQKIESIKRNYERKTGGVSIGTMLESLDSCAMRVLVRDEINQAYESTCETSPVLMQPIIEQLFRLFPNKIICCRPYPGTVSLFTSLEGAKNRIQDGKYILLIKESFFNSMNLQTESLLFEGNGVSGLVDILQTEKTISSIAGLAYQKAAMLFYDMRGIVEFQGDLQAASVYNMLHQ